MWFEVFFGSNLANVTVPSVPPFGTETDGHPVVVSSQRQKTGHKRWNYWTHIFSEAHKCFLSGVFNPMAFDFPRVASQPHLKRPVDSSACFYTDQITGLFAVVFGASCPIIRFWETPQTGGILPEKFLSDWNIFGAMTGSLAVCHVSSSARVLKGLEKESLSSN